MLLLWLLNRKLGREGEWHEGREEVELLGGHAPGEEGQRLMRAPPCDGRGLQEAKRVRAHGTVTELGVELRRVVVGLRGKKADVLRVGATLVAQGVVRPLRDLGDVGGNLGTLGGGVSGCYEGVDGALVLRVVQEIFLKVVGGHLGGGEELTSFSQ